MNTWFKNQKGSLYLAPPGVVIRVLDTAVSACQDDGGECKLFDSGDVKEAELILDQIGIRLAQDFHFIDITTIAVYITNK